MSKNHRGAGIRTLPAHGRGTCAICKKENINCLFENEIDGQTVNICKWCNASLKNKAKVEARKAKPAPAETPTEEAPATEAAETPATEAPAEAPAETPAE